MFFQLYLVFKTKWLVCKLMQIRASDRIAMSLNKVIAYLIWDSSCRLSFWCWSVWVCLYLILIWMLSITLALRIEFAFGSVLANLIREASLVVLILLLVRHIWLLILLKIVLCCHIILLCMLEIAIRLFTTSWLFIKPAHCLIRRPTTNSTLSSSRSSSKTI